MEKKQSKSVSVRMDMDTYNKLYAIAQQEGRTRSRQVLYWLRRSIKQYENCQRCP